MSESIESLAREVARAVGDTDDALDELTRAWRDGELANLPAAAADAARAIDSTLSDYTSTPSGIAGHAIASDPQSRGVVAAWATAAASRRELVLAPLLTSLVHSQKVQKRVEVAARRRVECGPLHDGLACLALSGNGAWLVAEDARATRARAELLLWEGGAMALSVPELGRWLFSHGPAIAYLVLDSAVGTLRQRAIAARALAVAADGARAP